MRHKSFFFENILAALLFLNCGNNSTDPHGGPKYRTGNAALLSVGGPGKDEDPSVVMTADGKIFVAWFSDRTGSGDIYIAMTSNGTTWTTPVQVTSDAGGEFDPSLFLDDNGVFHLAWFRWTALYVGNIVYNTSTDGLTWNQANEQYVTTTPNVDDWVPTLTQLGDSTLLIFFVSYKRNASDSTNDIFISAKRSGQPNWDLAQIVPGINSSTEHSHLPVAHGNDSGVTLIWVRYDTTNATPWLNAKSHLMYSFSPDGQVWNAPQFITNEAGNVVNLFPSLYEHPASGLTLVWLSTRLSPTPSVFEIPVSGFSSYPTGIIQDTMFTVGYSHKLLPTTTPGVYFSTWVQGPLNMEDVYYRFISK